MDEQIYDYTVKRKVEVWVEDIYTVVAASQEEADSLMIAEFKRPQINDDVIDLENPVQLMVSIPLNETAKPIPATTIPTRELWDFTNNKRLETN